MTDELTGIKKAIRDIIVSVVSDPKVEAMLDRLITEKFLPMIPIAVGAGMEAMANEVIERIPGASGIVNGAKAVEAARDRLNDLIPDFDIPLIGNLSDFWRPKP